MTLDTTVGTATSEAYISVADADAYFADRGNAVWAALSTPEKEQALRRATDYMTQTYRSRWKGYRVSVNQSLDWPRYNVDVPDKSSGFIPYILPFTTIPAEVARANAELALTASTEDLLPVVTQNVLREVIGPLRTDYDPNSPQETRRPAIDALLSIYLLAGGSSAVIKLARC